MAEDGHHEPKSPTVDVDDRWDWVGWVIVAGFGVLLTWAGYEMYAHPRQRPVRPGGTTTTNSVRAEAWFRLIKLLDIGYVVGLYIVTGIMIGIALSLAIPAFDARAADRLPFSVVLLEVIGHFWLLSLLVYAVRQVAEVFPSPWHNVAGLDHFRLKELNQPALFTVVLTQTQSTLLARVAYLIQRARKGVAVL
jgi:hypothetical protein